MLRYSQPEMKQLMQQRYIELQKEFPLVVDAARDYIHFLLLENNQSLMRAFQGESGAEPHQYSVLNEAFYVITHFLEQERLGNHEREIDDLQREVWFRMYLNLPPLVLDRSHGSLH